MDVILIPTFIQFELEDFILLQLSQIVQSSVLKFVAWDVSVRLT